MTIPLELQMHATVRAHPEQLHAAAMQTKPRFHFLDRLAHPRFEIERVQSMEEEQTGNQRIVTQFIDHRHPAGPES